MAKPLSIYNKKCQECNNIFITNYTKKIFCTKKCAYINKRKKLITNKILNKEKYEKQALKYKQTAYNKRKNEGKLVYKNEIRICECCKQKFKPKTHNNIFCSKKCSYKNSLKKLKEYKKIHGTQKYNDWYNKRYARINNLKSYKVCKICNIRFERIKGSKNTICSLKCVNENNRKIAREKYNRNPQKYISMNTDTPFKKIKHNIRVRIKEFLISKNIVKWNKTEYIIGCNHITLKKHLEEQFVDGMNWNNYGFYGWHIDHIYPLSKAKNIKHLKELCHYTNLQPLWAKDNLKKSSKVIQ